MTESWAVAFLWTCALELPVYVVGVGGRFSRWWSVCAATLVLNAATHPALWFAFPQFQPRALWLLAAEATVVAAETVLLALVLRATDGRATPARALWTALAANTWSAVVGLAAG